MSAVITGAKILKLNRILNKYIDNDYFGDAETIKNKIAERDRFYDAEIRIKGVSNLKKEYPNEVIENIIRTNTRGRLNNSTVKPLKAGIERKDLNFLVGRVRYDQTLTMELFTHFTGFSLPKTNKGIKEVLKTFCEA